MATAMCSNLSASVAPSRLHLVNAGRVVASRGGKKGARSTRSATESTAPRSLRLLFVEDDERVVYSLSRLLATENFEVQAALNGHSALQLAQQADFDLMILDLGLPDRSGIEVLRQLRLEGNWTPAVILTGRGDFTSALEAGKLGVIAYLTKPPKLPELVRALHAGAKGGRSQFRPLFAPALTLPTEGVSNLLALLRSQPDLEHEHAVRILAKATSLPDLAFPEFLAISRGLRSLSIDLSQTPASGLVRVRQLITDAIRRGPTLGVSKVPHILTRIEKAGRTWSKLSDMEVAAELGIPTAALGQLLSDECGLTFVRLRRSVVMRRCALELASGNDHVRQIAYRLGYTDAANLDHDFRDFFGLTPTALRRLQI